MVLRAAIGLLAVLSVCAGCSSNKKKSGPSKADIEAMGLKEQCKALEPKLNPCANEYILESMRALGGDKGMTQLRSLVEKRLERDKKAAHVMCKASPPERMVEAVLTCYDKDNCRDLAACVIHQENLIAARERRKRGAPPKPPPKIDVEIRDGKGAQ
jgi:hypothetical protein